MKPKLRLHVFPSNQGLRWVAFYRADENGVPRKDTGSLRLPMDAIDIIAKGLQEMYDVEVAHAYDPEMEAQIMEKMKDEDWGN